MAAEEARMTEYNNCLQEQSHSALIQRICAPTWPGPGSGNVLDLDALALPGSLKLRKGAKRLSALQVMH